MENKQTAVEWLMENLHTAKDPFTQAKVIEKEQQKLFFDCGRQYQLTGEGTFNQVHNEIFNTKMENLERIKSELKGSKLVYVSGKITGMEELAAVIFDNAETILTNLGIQSLNPMKLNHDHDKSWESYMRVCIKALCDCDCIYILPNYKESRGALMEIAIAKDLGLKLVYEQQSSTL